MNAKEFFKESTLLALAMTLPPIVILVILKLLKCFEVLYLVLWIIFAVTWNIVVSFLYLRLKSPRPKNQ